MKKSLKICLKFLAVLFMLFTGTFLIYIFNLDMKMMTFLEPLLEKWYNSREHDQYL